MTRYLLAATALATALAAIASPAVARDRSAYFGLEVGALFVKDTDVGLDDDDMFDDDFHIDHKLGVDGDMIAGYDFGMFRAEAELGYKRSEHDEYDLGSGAFDADGRSSVYSLTLNAMVDLGPDEGFQFTAGAGAGLAQVIHVLEDDDDALKIKDRGFAWQLIAGVRAPVSQYFDVGAKYRYFDAGNVSDRDEGIRLDSDYKSHSLLISLIHNFNVPEPPVPPAPVLAAPPRPPAPPATQTCPDGSVILATDVCPMPPPPPPPPLPGPVRG
ncbi:outer membrane beta-barrel protein [Sphingomonas sp.]|uniref:outer membrane protein n=1 Tax=Sphingomonas sp. TaxID=28214 RepID=UPI0017987D51|nr:outer membrane beta-barrel protein [Sphingomonas sp.]MBA3512579.1 porin family protein [Sphingomonas sp.]